MIIAVNTRLLKPSHLEGIGVFTSQIFSRMVQAYPEHEFHFIYDHHDFSVIGEYSNVHHHWIFPPARRPWLFDWWFDYSVPRLLKKIRADIFVSPDGHGSLRCPCPQLTVIHDLNFLHFPNLMPIRYSRYWNRHTPRIVELSDRIATVSNFSCQDLMSSYSISADRIDVLCNGYTDHWKPLTGDQRTISREKFSSGRPYLIYVGSIHPRKNIKRMLEAFDRFYLESGKQVDLVVVGSPLWKGQDQELMKGMQSKEGVHWLGRLDGDDLYHAIGGAEGLLLLSHFEGFGIPIVEAFACGVPVLTAHHSALQEVGDDAVLYANELEIEDMASQMSTLCFDIEKRTSCINAGLIRKELYTWERASCLMWKSILKTVNHA
jgi:glycosyltransferase involved in cell wall biosynthesis